MACICKTNSIESLGAYKFFEQCEDSHGFLLISLQYRWFA
jgi:hypothetical protein